MNLIFYFKGENFVRGWMGEKYIFNEEYMFSLLILSVSTSIQHTCGIFIMAVGNQYRYIRNLSFIIMAVILLSWNLKNLIDIKLEMIVLINSILYMFGTFFYYIKSIKIFKIKHE